MPTPAIAAASTSESTPASQVARPNKTDSCLTVAQIPNATPATTRTTAKTATGTWPTRRAGNLGKLPPPTWTYRVSRITSANWLDPPGSIIRWP